MDILLYLLHMCVYVCERAEVSLVKLFMHLVIGVLEDLLLTQYKI